MKRIFILLLAVCLLGSTATAQRKTVKWYTIQSASQLKGNNKLYFVDFYTNWCGWCKRMDSDVFSDTTIAKILNKYYVPVKFNAEGTSNFDWHGTHYNGPVVPPGGRPAVHGFTRAILGKQIGFPSFAIFDKDQSTLTILQGYQPVDELMVILWYLASGDHKKHLSFDKYKSIFAKEIKPQMEAALK